MVQSDDGLLWFGTWDGLNFACTDSLMQTRTTFRHFTTQDGLLSNLVHAMTDDGKGHYWVVAENGLTQLDPQTGLTVNYRSDHFGNELKFAETVPLLRGDTLLLGTNLGVLSLRLNELPQDTYTPAIVLTEMRVQGQPLHRDANRIDVLTLSPEQRNISFRFAAVDFVNSSTIQYAYRLRGLEEQWNEVGNTRSASYMNLPAGEYTLEIRSTNSSLVFNDPHGMLWVIPEHEALCYYDAGTDCFRTYLRNPEDPSSSYVPFIRYSLLDRQGNLWYAPYTGLEKVSFLPHFFTLHTLEKEMDIRSFLNDRQGNLWVGSQNGTLRIYQHGDKRPLYVTPQGKLTTQPSAFPGGAYALLQARNGDIWLGTKEAGLYRLRPSGARHFTVSHYTPEPGNPYSLSANSVYALCEDSRGRIWVGTFGGGLNLVQEHADGQVQFIHRGNVLKGFPLKDARIRCLKESPDSILLVGTTDGLIACRTSFRHPEDIIFRHHRHIGGATYLKTRIRTLIRRRQELQEFYRARFQPHPEETAAPADAESAPTAYEPKRPQLESLDDRFMEQVMECIEQNMDNQDFEIETLAEHLFMSRTVFYRKLKSITGMTPVAFVGEMRIKRALQLMEDDGLTISQVAYMTGFNSPKYFSKVFKKAVGCTPSEYKEQKKGNDE